MTHNRIPRNARKIYITWRIATTGNAAGDHATVEKTERGWIETTATGKQYFMPLDLLRNCEAVQIDQIETDASTDVLLINAGVQVYIIDGSRRTDEAALALIKAMENAGRIAPETAERARNDRRTLDKIKMTMTHYHMTTRETATGARWTFSSASGVALDIPAYEANYIRADKQGNLYPVEAPTAPETITGKEDTTTDQNSAQEATETASAAADPDEAGTAAARLDESRTDRPTPPPLEENHTEPRKACEIAPERTERAAPEQTPTTGSKTPYRAKLKAARRRSEIPRIDENRIFARLSYPHFAGTSYPHRGYLWGGLPPQKNNAIQSHFPHPLGGYEKKMGWVRGKFFKKNRKEGTHNGTLHNTIFRRI